MGKGIDVSGTLRGKVAERVYYRRQGEQIVRQRIRQISNPKSVGQRYQRAIMATVMRVYSAGQTIFDHSFQGKKEGSECQQRFLSVNAQELRHHLGVDLVQEHPEDMLGRFVAQGVDAAVPFNGLIISEGSYQQNLFTVGTGATSGDKRGFRMPNPQSGEKLGEYLTRINWIPGDIYTFVKFEASSNDDPVFQTGDTDFDKIFDMVFSFERMTCKEITNQTILNLTASEVPLVTIFTFDESQTTEDANTLIGNVLSLSTGTSIGAAGMIRSRKNEDLRSNSKLVFLNKSQTFPENHYGLTANNLLKGWPEVGEKLVDSRLILEGGGFTQGEV